MRTFLPLPKKIIKTTDDLQTVLVILFLLFIIGFKCYTLITGPPGNNPQLKAAPIQTVIK